METVDILSLLKKYGIGRRKLDDGLFSSDKPPIRLGIYDEDEENQFHQVASAQCTIPGCNFTADSTLKFENHYNSMHRYSCSQCKKVLLSPHLLDLHVQEQHDSFFAVLAERKPSYSCYIEECKEKFMNSEERLNHCVKIHKLPKDYRFDCKPKQKLKNKGPKQEMQVNQTSKNNQKFKFKNSRQKGFSYTGKKFTHEQNTSASVDIDAIMVDLKETLPES